MKRKMDIDDFIRILLNCKEDGCTEVVFYIEKKDGVEQHLSILQSNNEVIFSTRKALPWVLFSILSIYIKWQLAFCLYR